MPPTTTEFPALENEADVPSPSLLIYPDRVDANLRRMMARVGDPARLRPHIKTHKLPQIVARQVELGVTKCKAATIAETEMAARAGATDIILAAQLVGPNVARFLALMRAHPRVAFATIVDDPGVVANLSRAAVAASTKIEVLLDLNIGQNRTGIAPGAKALELYRQIASAPGLRAGGLHAYDGHLSQSDLAERSAASDAAFATVSTLRDEIVRAGLTVPRLVCGGTPTFPLHAKREGIECSPGTCVLWDAGYRTKIPDLEFENAAVLLTRVISRPAANRLCLDLGHKAVASEMPHPRAIFPALLDAKGVVHSEEHLVIETARAENFPPGTAIYALPWHICPTVALHSSVQIVRGRRVVEEWPVTARARKLSI